MKWKGLWQNREKLLFIALALALLLNLQPLLAEMYMASGTCRVEMGSGGLGFQIGSKEVVLTVVSGYWNTSTASIQVGANKGIFKFHSINTTTLNLEYVEIANVKISGDMGNEQRPLASGNNFNFQDGNDVTVSWFVPIEPTLPIMFIIGVVGLIGMFGGPAYAIHKLKQKDYYEAVRIGVLITATGFALFIAWLFTT